MNMRSVHMNLGKGGETHVNPLKVSDEILHMFELNIKSNVVHINQNGDIKIFNYSTSKNDTKGRCDFSKYNL